MNILNRAGWPLPVGGALAVLLLVATGCVDDPAAPEPEPDSDGAPISLAAALAESGRHSPEGTEVSRGYRLAVEILNENGGIRGRPVQLEIRDDGSDARRSARLYASFIASDTIDALLGPFSSPITEVVLAVTEAAGEPIVAPMAATPGIWAGRERQWSAQLLNPGPTYLHGSVEAAVFGGARTVAIVYEDTSFPSSVVQGVREAAEAHGLDIVMDQSYAVGAADHEAIAAAARDARADLFIGGGYTADAVGFASAAPAVGYQPLLMSLILGPGQPQFADAVGRAARCVAGNAPWHPTIRTSGFIADSETFVSRYEAAHGKTPGYHAAGGFAAVELLAEGLDETLPATGDPDPVALRDFLFTTQTETVLGSYHVAPLGDAEAGAQRGLKGLQVQWQDDGAGGLALRIIHPWAAAEAVPCYMR